MIQDTGLRPPTHVAVTNLEAAKVKLESPPCLSIPSALALDSRVIDHTYLITPENFILAYDLLQALDPYCQISNP